MDSQTIRRKYLDFFKSKNHKIIPRASLMPQDDATTLFTGSGMQPMVPYLLGENHPEGKRIADSQVCFRSEDIEEVGDNRHLTLFEMLGNWSLGDYYKQDQISWAWELYTEVFGLDSKRLYITCFIGDEKLNIPKDEESANIWRGLFKAKNIDAKIVELGSSESASEKGINDGRIFYYDASKNWWSREGQPSNMREGEPGGPDSEIFYDFGTQHDKSFGKYCHPNCECGRFGEIGNSVFMAYRKINGQFKKLPNPNVDFGGGLERITAAINNDADLFKTSLLYPVIKKLEEFSGKSYKENVFTMRFIADHIRAAVWLAVDGVVPSNNEQGYVMRRLLRRAIRYGLELEIHQDICALLSPVIVDIYKNDYPEIGNNQESIKNIFEKEEKIFRQTLTKGVREFNKMTTSSKLTGEAIFTLYDTYGFPKELSIEEAHNQQIEIDKNWEQEFDKYMKEQKERSRTATKGIFKGGLAGEGDIHKKYHTATHLMYKALKIVLGEHVTQRGSNITDERLRFDFSHDGKVTDEQLKQVEEIVNQQIKNDLTMSFEELPTKKALEMGAAGAFGDKYGDVVKVYSAKNKEGEVFSFEICGGPHVEHTSQLAEGGKRFKITKEESSSAGVRRIKAVLV